MFRRKVCMCNSVETSLALIGLEQTNRKVKAGANQQVSGA